MNKISGYKLFRLADGTELELKFCNGTTEIFAKSMGLNTAEEIDSALKMDLVDSLDEAGQSVKVPQVTVRFIEAFRKYVLAAATYPALVQNKPVSFNEWQVSEWIEELGYEAIYAVIEKPAETTDAKKKAKVLIKPTQ